MRIAGMVQDSIVDGPGIRFTVFAQGCPRHCEGCHNPETLDPAGGREISAAEVIAEMRKNPLTDGLTLSGGEPFLQAGELAEVADAARAAGLNVWTYTGYTFEDLLASSRENADIAALLAATDVLADGEFILAEKSFSVKWRGSRNQRLIGAQESLRRGAAVILE
ncbi:MAG: anaerobic ribonucleoside-triphosphate reductase activating protein [Oscillospiraceae bacterium]|nr:anaerobic ribonucleoside-triphosphate reductase activating protein [Oscillospiraceae bacterium]